MYNAESLWARYFVEADYFSDDSDMEYIGQHRTADASAAEYYSRAPMITGHKAYCPMPAGCGLSIWSGLRTTRSCSQSLSQTNIYGSTT